MCKNEYIDIVIMNIAQGGEGFNLNGKYLYRKIRLLMFFCNLNIYSINSLVCDFRLLYKEIIANSDTIQ